MKEKKTPLKEQIDLIEKGDPPDENAGLFGLSVDENEASLILMPVAWEATTSYGKGTARAPKAILRASHQLDLYDLYFGEPYKKGITLLDENKQIVELNKKCLDLVTLHREKKYTTSQKNTELIKEINSMGDQLNKIVKNCTSKYIKQNKLVGLIGGEHSIPYGFISALSEKYLEFGILHIDAHFDLRASYENFKWSHASIMYNVLKDFPQIVKVVQFGIRDFSTPEYNLNQSNIEKKRTLTFFDRSLFNHRIKGKSLLEFIEKCCAFLPENVYISFDIDGLSPDLCPSTGTPVPGGLSFNEASFILESLIESGKKIIGFDLCEVAPSMNETWGEWDENVASRILYKLCGASLS